MAPRPQATGRPENHPEHPLLCQLCLCPSTEQDFVFFLFFGVFFLLSLQCICSRGEAEVFWVRGEPHTRKPTVRFRGQRPPRSLISSQSGGAGARFPHPEGSVGRGPGRPSSEDTQPRTRQRARLSKAWRTEPVGARGSDSLARDLFPQLIPGFPFFSLFLTS